MIAQLTTSFVVAFYMSRPATLRDCDRLNPNAAAVMNVMERGVNKDAPLYRVTCYWRSSS